MRIARAVPALMAAGLLSLLAAPRAYAAADSVLVRVGGDLTGRAGQYVDVPVTVDLSGAPGRQLGSYRAQLAWDATRLEFVQIKAGNFAPPQANSGTVAGTEQVTAVLPAGAGGVVTVFVAQFYVLSDTAPSPVTVAFDEMSATATSTPPFQILLPLLKYVQGVFCRSLGKWGDVNGDGQSNSLDALVTLSVVVGDTVPAFMTPALADVDADSAITSRDALIMLSYAVGLPVTGYRVLLPAAGACGTGAASTLVIAPDSVELQTGQGVAVLAQAMDGLGRAVPADSLTWTSSNPAIAGYDPISGQVKGRSAGFATLTAQVGPGVQGTLKVSVIARRSTWYVDVQRALNAPAQLGTQALPFQFIGDAVTAARDGDTVRVASGTYEETVSTSVSVALLGDSVNRPVVDPRAYQYWAPYLTTVALGSAAGPLVVAHLVVRAGGVFLNAHDITVRDVAVQGLGGTQSYAALEVTSGALNDAPPARDGRMRARAPESPGNVLIDGVSVTADSTTNGILVDLADTVVVRNSAITRAAPGQGGCSPSPFTGSGILITQASVSVVQNNVVTNPECQGIGVYDGSFTFVTSDVGRATISRNRVSGAPGTGIAVETRLVAVDHNTVRGVLNGQFYYGTNAAGIEVVASGFGGPATDSVTSLTDSVLTVKSYYSNGLRVDTAAVAVVDSLVVDDIGTDSSNSNQGAGLYFTGRRLTLTNSHVSNTQGTGVEGRGQMVYRSRGNTVRNTKAGVGVLLAGPNCECTTGGPDSVLIALDSISGTAYTGVEIDRALYAQLDTAVVDSTGGAFYDAIDLTNVPRALVRGAVGRRADIGLYASQVDTLSVLGGLFQDNVDGVYVYFPADTVTISGVTVDNNSGSGIYLDSQAYSRIDSLVATNNQTGLDIAYFAGAAARRSRFEGNGTGLWMETSAQSSSSVVNSNFLANVLAGVRNDAYGASGGVDLLAADTNYWNDPAGPTCNAGVTGFSCPGLTGDSIVTAGVTFGGFLTGAAPAPAGRMRPLVAAARWSDHRAAAVRAVSGPRQRPAKPSARETVVAPAQPARASLVTAPRPPRVKVAPWHKPVRPQGIRVSRKS